MPILVHVSVILRQGERTLLVQVEKQENYEKWNLPGGHLEIGESIQQGAIREAREETGLSVILCGIVGVYTGIRKPEYQAIRFVFAAQHTGSPIAGDEILAVRWFSPVEIETSSDAALVGGANLRAILTDAASDHRFPLSLLTESS